MNSQLEQKMLRIEPNHHKKHHRYFLGKDYPGIYFTARELQVSTHLRDKKYREIAILYGLSERTIEYYVTTIKYKIKCSTKIELIDKLDKLGIFN